MVARLGSLMLAWALGRAVVLVPRMLSGHRSRLPVDPIACARDAAQPELGEQ